MLTEEIIQMLKKWEKTKSVALAGDICEQLLETINEANG